jgi:hypothetical protein
MRVIMQSPGSGARISSNTEVKLSMPSFDDSKRGYAFPTHQRDGFICRYCGVDGSTSFDTWLTLSWGHLLPTGHIDRDNPDFIVTACNARNTADNRFFSEKGVDERRLKFEGMPPDELVEQRRPWVLKTVDRYKAFWEEHVSAPALDE